MDGKEQNHTEGGQEGPSAAGQCLRKRNLHWSLKLLLYVLLMLSTLFLTWQSYRLVRGGSPVQMPPAVSPPEPGRSSPLLQELSMDDLGGQVGLRRVAADPPVPAPPGWRLISALGHCDDSEPLARLQWHWQGEGMRGPLVDYFIEAFRAEGFADVGQEQTSPRRWSLRFRQGGTVVIVALRNSGENDRIGKIRMTAFRPERPGDFQTPPPNQPRAGEEGTDG